MLPVVVTLVVSRGSKWLALRVALEPLLNVIVVQLLGPQHTGQSLALNPSFIFTQTGVLHSLVKLVSLGQSLFESLVEIFERSLLGHICQP